MLIILKAIANDNIIEEWLVVCKIKYKKKKNGQPPKKKKTSLILVCMCLCMTIDDISKVKVFS